MRVNGDGGLPRSRVSFEFEESATEVPRHLDLFCAIPTIEAPVRFYNSGQKFLTVLPLAVCAK